MSAKISVEKNVVNLHLIDRILQLFRLRNWMGLLENLWSMNFLAS